MKSRSVLIVSIINLVLMSLFVFSLENSEIAIHYNINGVIDNTGSKWFLLLFAIVSFILSIIYVIYELKTENNEEIKINRMIERRIIPSIIIMFMAIGWIFALFNNSIYYLISYTTMLLGIFIVFLGFNIKCIKRNKFLGVKTHWALQSDIVWDKTHKFASKCMVLSGVLMLSFSILSIILLDNVFNIIGVLILIILSCFLPVVYSYIIYKRQ